MADQSAQRAPKPGAITRRDLLRLGGLGFLGVCATQLAPWVPRLFASTLTLKDGRTLEGRLGTTTGLADNPLTGAADGPATIVLVDDDLRRVFLPKFQIGQINPVNTGGIKERVAIRQRVATGGNKINRVGPIVKITAFDNYGRRTLTMMTEKGKLDVIQGITMITPTWTKVEGLVTETFTPLVWDMRIATSSIPRETLHAILVNNTQGKNLEQRLRVVRMFLQSERYKDAEQELQGVIDQFPDEQDLAKEVQALRQLHARSIVKEIELRKAAGQHALAYSLLEQFPTKDVAGETLQQVREMLQEYQGIQSQLAEAGKHVRELIGQVQDPTQRAACEVLFKEMSQELGFNTRARLAAYQQLRDDKSLGAEQKLSLALSGWLLGGDSADTNLMVTLALAKMRDLIHRYMNEPVKLERNKIAAELHALEGASTTLVARLVAHMKPPLETPEGSLSKPGFHTLTVPIGIDREPDVTYHVQLPPGYDPHVRYPAIVTLNGSGTTPENHIDWWAGHQDAKGNRLGQATRQGYIVVAVDWLKEGQVEYGFTAREHASVLASLRDACRRFAIDTDRVFLSGHSIGGDAAWDVGLAHPDLWAGVIPIVAQSKKYCSHYWPNARLVPFYVVQGEMDGDKLKENAKDLDRYMSHRFDVTVVEYQGRGHEDFYDDIQNIFDWMDHRAPRNFFPKEFAVSTMRTWDNYFYWLEATQLPEKAMVEPSDWPPPRGIRAAELKAKILANGDLVINSGGIRATVWLAPEILNANRTHIAVTVNGKATRVAVQPSIEAMLDDVRTRGDRQHPFFARVEL